MNKPTLWIMCGLSGSGKSTIATQIANENQNTIIVSSDAIREELTGNYEDQEHNEEVFKIFHDRIRKNLENKKNVIADATNLTMKSRRAIMMKVNGLEVHKVCVVIPKPFEQCNGAFCADAASLRTTGPQPVGRYIRRPGYGKACVIRSAPIWTVPYGTGQNRTEY